MRAFVKYLSLAAATMVGFAAALYWALGPLLTAGSFWGNDDAEMVRRYFSFRVVQPEWLGNAANLFPHWIAVETRARLIIVAVLWLMIGIATGYKSITGLRAHKT